MNILRHEVRQDNDKNIVAVINKKDTVEITCSNPACKKPLLIIHHTPDEHKNIQYNLRVECPFCPRRSFDFEIKGDLKYVTVDGVLLIGIEEIEKDNIVIIKTKKVN